MAKKSKKKTATKAKKSSKVAPKKVAKKIVKKAASKTKKAAKKVAPQKAVKKKVTKKANRKPAPAKTQRNTGINPYLTFAGNCEEVFHFYQSVFGGKFNVVMRFGEMPPMEGQPPVPESEKNRIMHMSLPIGGASVLMGSDSSGAFGHVTNVGNNISLSVNAKSRNEADHLFNGLSGGGMVTMPIGNTFWGSYFGMCVDKYGIQWQISFDENPTS